MRVPARLAQGEDLEAITRDAVLTRGLGRAYGDAALPPRPGARVAGSRLADRVLALDEARAVLRAEAGISLLRLHQLLLPRRLLVPVVPGTAFVTLGGMVAADVHGKNHHLAGSFGDHVRALRMRLASGEVREVRAPEQEDLLRATIGGMGLTGHILEVEIDLARIPSPWLIEEREVFPDLESLLAGLLADGARWPYTVAWADALARGAALGRGVVSRARFAEPPEAPEGVPARGRHTSVPLDLPWLPRFGVALHNRLRLAATHSGRRTVSPYASFHPLDAAGNWNRLYGRHGFTQHQCVIPREAGTEPVHELFRVLARTGASSYLVVIKDFGREGRGLLSFPRPGITVCLDLPLADPRTRPAVEALDEVVIAAGGRIYLAKDQLTGPAPFRRLEPRLEAFLAARRRFDPERRLSSALAVRLFGDPA
ncbi:MAG: FAD-binding oxidoreductase [Deltaproteobacteria bacterium]|nr:FAD-binding oxidoreductase [Deltaproteobacteria bacterium]